DAAGAVQPQPALRPSAGGTPGAPARTRAAGRGGALHAPGNAGLGPVLLRQQPGADGSGAVGALVLVDALHRVDLIRPDRPVVRWRMAGTSASKETRMTWLPLTDLLLQPHAGRQVALAPALDHAELQQRALRLAATLQQQGVRCVALYLEDAGELAIALLGAWRAGAQVLLPADAQPQSRQRLATQVDLWLDALSDSAIDPLPAAALDPERCRLTLCTSGSSGEPKLIDTCLRPLANQ